MPHLIPFKTNISVSDTYNQWILMQFSLLDFKENDTCEGMNFTHLT